MSGWFPHSGGANPVPGETVRVRFRDGGTNTGPSTSFLGWFHEPPNGSAALRQDDIVGYAVIQKPGGSVRRAYTKTDKWHQAKARRATIPPSSKADFLKSPERLEREAARRLSVPSDDTPPGTDERSEGVDQ